MDLPPADDGDGVVPPVDPTSTDLCLLSARVCLPAPERGDGVDRSLDSGDDRSVVFGDDGESGADTAGEGPRSSERCRSSERYRRSIIARCWPPVDNSSVLLRVKFLVK